MDLGSRNFFLCPKLGNEVNDSYTNTPSPHLGWHANSHISCGFIAFAFGLLKRKIVFFFLLLENPFYRWSLEIHHLEN